MNNTRLCVVILVTVLVCFTQPTNAQNTRGDPRGTIGGQDCGTWFDVRQAKDIDDGGRYWGRQMLEQWVMGFITGLNMNAAAKNVFALENPLNKNQIFLWLDKYCRENPMSGMSSGIWDLFRELPDERLERIE